MQQKNIAKGRDLQDDGSTVTTLESCISKLKQEMHSFNERLEALRVRFEGAARLHHLIAIQVKENDVHNEMKRLAEKLNLPLLTEKCKMVIKRMTESASEGSLPHNTRDKNNFTSKVSSWNEQSHNAMPPLIEDQRQKNNEDRQNTIEEDEEEHSKMADSGLGGCDRCEGNEKLTRACSCQSFDDATNACDKRLVYRKNFVTPCN